MSTSHYCNGVVLWREKLYEDAAFAEAPTGHVKQESIPVEKVGHFISAVFGSYMFHGTQNRDRFVNLYRSVGARQVGRNPCL